MSQPCGWHRVIKAAYPNWRSSSHTQELLGFHCATEPDGQPENFWLILLDLTADEIKWFLKCSPAFMDALEFCGQIALIIGLNREVIQP